ncbi:MAG: SUMF1/EgtB/PvdO family nonheme iron enzyme [Bacteroidetes bacterium]|nr:SUMF1/EgtB/PvdO family nonheme iron enzyme [Bacteroidota bacterium]
MQENLQHINNQEFDQLLLGIFLEEENNELQTNKTIDMTAAIVFNQNPNYIPNISKETELLNNLNQAFISKPKGGFWLNLIIVLSLVFTATLIFNLWPKNQNDPQQNQVLAQSVNHESKDSTANESENNLHFTPTQIDSIKSLEKTHKDTNKISQKSNQYIDNNSPNIPDNYGQNTAKIKLYEPDYYPVKDPVFDAIATPENFSIRNYATSTYAPYGQYRNLIICNSNYSYPFYVGIPFKKEFEDMIYFFPNKYQELIDYKNFDSLLKSFNKISKFNISYSKDSIGLYENGIIKIKRPLMGYYNYFPISILRQCDSSKVNFVKDYVIIKELPEKAVIESANPFYFRKFEVTNKEYREFTDWVKEANGYGNKKILELIKDSTEVQVNSDFETKLKEMSKEERNGYTLIYKNNKLDRAYKKKFNKAHYYENIQSIYKYTFFNASKEMTKVLGSNSTYIYPDTMCWVNDFTYSFNEPMTQYYNWHPAYDNYPVVGINYWQAMAYLDWKTHFLQKYLDNANIPYDIEYSLPSDVEWEMISTNKDEHNTKQSILLHDDSWLCDLLVDSKTGTFHNALRKFLLKDNVQFGNFVYDGAFHTITVGHFKPNKSGVFDLDKNVSEWMKDNYSDSWGPMFTKHIQQMEKSKNADTMIIATIEKHYDKDNAKKGQLVRGGNWADERYSEIDGENKAGLNLKKYIDPSESHSTIGFRHVLHVKLKNEVEIVKEMKLLSTSGNCMTKIDAAPYRGKKIKVTAAIKMKESNPKISTGHLWLQVNLQNSKTGFFDYMTSNPIINQEWKTYEIIGEVAKDAISIGFGGFMKGTGKMWVDDFKFYVKEGRNWVPINLENSSFENGTKEEIVKKWYLLGDKYNIIPTEEDHFEGKRCISIEKSNE